MDSLVTYELSDGVARIRMDDGKVNAMGAALLGQLHAAFDRAAADGAVAVLTGREAVFSAGFDLKVLTAGAAHEFFTMFRLGAELALKVLSFPRPVIAAASGHAYPMGAFLMLASDWRIGAEGDWRIGLNEVQIGIPVPRFAVEVARQRLAPAYFSRTTVTGEMFAPAEALAAGFLDEVVPPGELEAAVARAAARLKAADPAAHRVTKQRVRGAAIAAIREAIDSEVTMAYAESVAARRAA